MAEADRFIEPGLGRYRAPDPSRFGPVAPERFIDPEAREKAKIEAQRSRQLNASRIKAGAPINARTLQSPRLSASLRLATRQMDRATQEAQRSRQLRQDRLKTLKGTAKLKGMAQDSALAKLEQLQKYYKQFRAIFTIIGGLTSLTIIGIIWTLLQWNFQMVFTIFGLPGKEYFALPMPYVMVPVTLFLDFLIFIIYAAIMLIAYFASNPAQICTIAPDVTKQLLSTGFLGTLANMGLTGACWLVNVVAGKS